MARVGYGKIGRSMPLSIERCGTLGGDVEMAAVVKTLAERNPEHTFVLIGRNDGSDPKEIGLPLNVENPWIEWRPQLLEAQRAAGLNSLNNMSVEQHFGVKKIYDQLTLPTIRELDGIVLWAGQHGTTNAPIPKVKEKDVLTKPYDWCAHYCAFLLHGVNAWREEDPWNREEVWLNADRRNYLKMRDLKWPLRHPVLTQFDFTNALKHERYGDKRDPDGWPNTKWIDEGVWKSQVTNAYTRLEVNGLVPGTPFGNLISFSDTWEGRGHFGLFINEARKYVSEATARKNALRDYVLPLQPDWIHGTWSAESQEELGVTIAPAPWELYYPRLHSVRATLTTPSSGSGWATTKPWEAFAAGTVCFFHPEYDKQDNILRDADPNLREWLRIGTPADLRARVNHLSTSAGRGDWEWLIRAQRAHFDRAMNDLAYAQIIEQRLFGMVKHQ